jgi:hypothetical protein
LAGLGIVEALASRGAAAEEKNAEFFCALLTALRDRRVTPREVSIVNDDDDEEDVVRKRGYVADS